MNAFYAFKDSALRVWLFLDSELLYKTPVVDEAASGFYWFQSLPICGGNLLSLQFVDHRFKIQKCLEGTGCVRGRS